MQHRLVFCFDSGSVRQNQDFGDEVAVHFGLGDDAGLLVWLFRFVQHDHAFPDVLTADVAQREAGRLAGGAARYLDALAFDGANFCSGELAEAIRADEDGVARMDLAGFDYPGYDGAYEGD